VIDPADVGPAAAFLVGLLGSVHCVGMCGGIAGTLALGVTPKSPGLRGLAPFLVAYNLGRISTYTLAGALAGALGGALGTLAPDSITRYGGAIGGLFLLALGLYVSGFAPVLGIVERWGLPLWRRIEPVGRRLIPARTPLRALALGTLWGWLPCGMVYAVLAWSVTTASAFDGAVLMAAFGLGTLPMLLGLGATSRWMNTRARNPLVRQLAGLALIAIGAAEIWLVLTGPGHAHMHHH